MTTNRTSASASAFVDHRAARPCAWCARDVPIVRRPGRPRLYCNHGCRQRAYEHRHGFCHVRTTRPLPGQLDDDRPTQSTGYEAGGHGYGGGIVHALRTSVRPEGQRRETLCGVLAAPSDRPFSTIRPHACRTCSTVARDNPLPRPVRPSNELARLRALIDETIEHRLRPAEALTWLLFDGRRGGRRPFETMAGGDGSIRAELETNPAADQAMASSTGDDDAAT